MRRITALILALVSVLCIFTGCGAAGDNNETLPTEASSTALLTEPSEVTTAVPTTVPETTAPKETKPEKVQSSYEKDTTPLPNYNSVKNVYDGMAHDFAKGIVALCKGEDYSSPYGSNPVANYYMVMGLPRDPQNVLSSVGYYINDINGDGVPEMVICKESLVIGLYTYFSGAPVQIGSSWNRSLTYILSDGKVITQGSNGAIYGTLRVQYLPARSNKLVAEVYYRTDMVDGNLGLYKNDVLIFNENGMDKFVSINEGYMNKVVSKSNKKLSEVYSVSKPTEPLAPETLPIVTEVPASTDTTIYEDSSSP